MRVYYFSTRHFEFHICAESDSKFVYYLRRAWKKRCKDYKIDYDPKYVKELIEEARWILVEPGVLYEDGHYKWEGK